MDLISEIRCTPRISCQKCAKQRALVTTCGRLLTLSRFAYLIGTSILALPNLAVKMKPCTAMKRNEEKVTTWPIPESCLQDISELMTADRRCIQCHIVEKTLVTPMISCRI